jgi:TPR repeat protein
MKKALLSGIRHVVTMWHRIINATYGRSSDVVTERILLSAIVMFLAWGLYSARRDPDPDSTVEVLQQACDGDPLEVERWGMACSALGDMYQSGRGVTQDSARARALYQQGCDAGYMMGCYNLGYMYETGEGVTKDTARAANLIQQACDGGLERACEHHVRGNIFDEACDGGSEEACELIRSWRRANN